MKIRPGSHAPSQRSGRLSKLLSNRGVDDQGPAILPPRPGPGAISGPALQEDRDNLEKWWPYVLRINGIAKAMLAVDDEDYDRALDIVHDTRDQIGSWPAVEAEEFFAERERSEAALEELEQDLLQQRPLSPVEQLQRSLQEAIDSEEFERAVVLRDEIKKLQEDS